MDLSLSAVATAPLTAAPLTEAPLSEHIFTARGMGRY